jgi:hypothetical protein
MKTKYISFTKRAAGAAFALVILSSVTAQADTIYRETFGNSDTFVRKSPNLYGWQGVNQAGTNMDVISDQFGVDSGNNLGRPGNLANINAGLNGDGTTDAQAGARVFWSGGSPTRLTYTPEYTVQTSLYQAGSIQFSFYLGNGNANDQVRLVIKQGGVWYYSATAFNTAAISGGNFPTLAELKTLTYSPVATNWLLLNFDGTYNGGGTPAPGDPGAIKTDSSTVLGSGGVPNADLTGDITAFGILSLGAGGTFNNPSGNIRWDTFQIDAALTTNHSPFTLLAPQVGTNGSFYFLLQGTDGVNYVIEATTNFSTWIPVFTNSPTSNFLQFTDSFTTNYPSRFFRGREQ